MSNILLLDSDRIISEHIKKSFSKRGLIVHIVNTADDAVKIADEINPSLVIIEISLPQHSGSEFLYEFRTYSDWQSVPILIYSSVQISPDITKSIDWQLLNISDILYKPDVSIEDLGISAQNVIESVR